ncbi:MAG: nucleoside deaminase [Desulfocapsaceae bacterium]|nr:nucleoside deaminase [Desulfocapsaceae bacterium]
MRHETYMLRALAEAEEALKRGEFPVGCVIADKEGILVSGQRMNSVGIPNEMDHAEIMALRALISSGSVVEERGDLIVYSTMEPCLMCFSTLILNGIHTIVYGYEDAMGGGTNLPLEKLNPLYAAMTVTVVPHILRQQSLSLFKRFFSRPDNRYWRDSFLARYTLAQQDEEKGPGNGSMEGSSPA